MPLSLRFRKIATVVVWIAGLTLAVTLLLGQRGADAQGIAWGTPVLLSAPEDGALLDLVSDLHDVVQQGQLIARLDPAPLVARREILAAELRALGVEESSEARGRERRFESDREEARRDQARLQASVAEEEVRLAAIEAELAREKRLASSGVRGSAVAEDLERQVGVIRTRLEAERERLLEAEQTARDARARAVTASGPNHWQVVAAERRLDEINQRLARLDLRSPIHGQVTQLDSAPGEWLEAGQPILRVSPTSTTEVHVWTRVQIAQKVQVGDPATVRRATGERVTATVLSVGVERLPLPQELWYRSDIREWGYLVRVELAEVGESEDPAAEQWVGLSPGEPVKVKLRG